MTIKAIIWDFGGVLVRTEDRRPRTMLADQLGMTYNQLEDLVFNSPSGRAAQLGQLSSVQNWEKIRKTLNISIDELPVVQTNFFGGDILDRELVSFIKSLRPKYKIGLLSNYASVLRSELSEKWGILELFDHITISGETGVMKPDAAIYQVSLQGLQVHPVEAVFIDDFQHNIQGAENIGIHGILFQGPGQVIASIQKLLNGTNETDLT